VTGARDPRIDAWIEDKPGWQQEVFRRLRELIHEAVPEIGETIKRSTMPFFVLDGNVCAFFSAKDHVNLFLYDGAIVPDPDRIITAGHENKTARLIAFREGDEVKERAIVAMLGQIAANNRAGGWRKIKEGRLAPPATR
jgi:hypothetical protein